jgi:L-galactose dehydrogenase
MLRNDGPPGWHFATPEVKTLVKEAGELCNKNGVELGKLAMWHTIQLPGPATFLSGMEKLVCLDHNLSAFFDGLNEKETEVYKQVMQIFSRVPKGQKHWEGIEVARYWEQMKQYKK